MRAWMAPPDTNVWVGRLIVYDSDVIRLRTVPAGEISLQLDSIERLEVSRGPNPLLVFGAPSIGAGLGVIVGPALMRGSIECEAHAILDDQCRSLTPKTVIGAAVGAVVLGFTGSLIARERWAEVHLSVPTAEGSGPPGFTMGIGLRP